MSKQSSAFVKAKPHAVLTTGMVIRSLRELTGWTQQELARRSAITVTNISALENDRIDIGKKRAIQLAKAFGVSPALIMFPEYSADELSSVA